MIGRVLVVDDHTQWRQHIRGALQQNPRWQVVSEAADGLDAVQQAKALKPDLILLDIGLPILDGIEAARRILADDPRARILFMSAHASWEFIEAALATGAQGYIVKSEAGRELLPAMEAIAEGRPFITARWTEIKADRHAVMFSSDEALLLDGYTDFAEAALAAGNACIVLTVDSRRNELRRRLRARGLDVDLAIEEGRFILLDVAETLSTYMVDGWPDEARFREAATSLITRAARAATGAHPRVAACGECAPRLWGAGSAGAAICVEELWDELARTFDMDVFCAYQSSVPPSDEDRDVFRSICAVHSSLHVR